MSSLLISNTNLTLLQTQVLASAAPIPGYQVVDATWSFPAGANGETLKLNGTIQEVNAKVDRDYPQLKRDFIPNAALDKRDMLPDPVWSEKALCPVPGTNGHNWQRASVYRIYQGIDYLNGFRGSLSVDAGPQTCARVSCSWNSAIYWCNDVGSVNSIFSDPTTLCVYTLFIVQLPHRYCQCQTPCASCNTHHQCLCCRSKFGRQVMGRWPDLQR